MIAALSFGTLFHIIETNLMLLFLAVTSWLAVILNKIVISKYGFSYPITMILIQIIVNILILLATKYLKYAEVNFPTGAQIKKVI